MKTTKRVRRYSDATLTTYSNRKVGYHREDGPSFVAEYIDRTYEEEWCRYGKLHRYDGPASIHRDGSHTYYIQDNNVTHEVNEWLDERGYVWEDMSDVEKWELEMFMRTLG